MKLAKFVMIPFCALLLTGCKSASSGGGGIPIIEGEVEHNSYNKYYKLNKYNLNGTTGVDLQREIHRLMLDTHKTQVKYSQFTQYTKVTTDRQYSVDQVNATTKKNEMFYTGSQLALTASYTREHVWPCAQSAGLWVHKNYSDVKYYVDHSKYVGGGSDLYHIRPCNSTVNTARGDSKYVDMTENEKAVALQMKDSNGKYVLLTDATQYSNYSEPADEFKGDCARIIMYVYVHFARIGSYGEKQWGDYMGNLDLKNVIGHNGDSTEQIYEQLIRWNNLDPVSETEKLRNETVQGIQGNRNPFVDYPNLLNKCLER